MIKTETREFVDKTKRKRKRDAENDESSQAPAKAAKIFKEKKLTAKRSHKSEDNVKNGDFTDKKSRSTQKITRPDGKEKPKIVRIVLIYEHIVIYWC